jgi:hypothetical protein
VSNYWKKKLDELNQSNANSGSKKSSSGATISSNYWHEKMTELEKEKKKKAAQKAVEGTIGAMKSVVDNVKSAPRDATFGDLTWNSFTRGYNSALLGEESFADMNGQENDREVYQKILSGDEYNFEPGNWFERAVSGAFELGGQMARQNTHPRTLAVATAAAGAAAIAGQIGPQVVVPEEVVTVPTAFAAGLAAGNAASALEIEAGHAYNEMLEAGVKKETARKVALAVGTVNASLEALQVDELLDAYRATAAKGATKTFTKKLAEELADRGVDVAKETVQEVVQEGVTITGVQTASKIDKGEWAYTAGEVVGRLGDTAKSSALSFGMMNVPAAVKNTVTYGSEKSTTTKLTENEQKVVDKVVEDEIEKKEKDGTKLSNREKSAIREDVIGWLDKGYISTDTIEDVLGDRSSYDSLAKESEEYNTLYNTASGQLSKAQQDRLAELEAKNKANSYDDALKNARAQFSQSVFELVRGDRLAESYNEKARRSQVFEADLSQYDTKQQAVIQKAIDSGILNNTRRTHEFVDMVAKISADKGVLFDFTDNERLKESSFAVDGKIVNGYFDKKSGTIGVNIDSAKALNFVVGHEITHVLEGTEVYDALKKTLIEYAKNKGEYQSRYNSLTELYKNGENTDLESELVADLVGDYLFTDADFINNLSTKHRNVFQKIYDELLYLCKIATAGSKEARELEKVKKAFEKAYKEGGKVQKNTANDGVNYSIERTKSMSWAEQINGALYDGKNIRRNDTLVVGNPGDTSVANEISDKPLAIPQSVLTKASSSKDISHSIKRGKLAKLDEGIKNAPITIVNPDRNAVVYVTNIKQGGLPIVAAFDMDATFDGDEVHKATSIHLQVDTQSMLENLPESATVYVQKNELDPVGATNNLRGLAAKIKFINDNISQKDPDVKVEFSLSDSDGNQLSKEQQEYFKDSKMRDENGSLKVMYHGTPNGDFTVFRDGTYFTDNKEYADRYQNPSASSISSGKAATAPKTFEVYLDIKKPFDINDAEARNIYINDYIKGGNAIGINPYLSDAEYDKIKTIDWTEGEDLRDFLIDNGYDYDGLVLDEGADGGYGDEVKSRGTSYVVFNPEQVKNTDNLKPTADPDIRFSLSEAVEESKDLMALHNLTEAKLLKSLKLGGLPMPSVAIAKAKDGHGEFGEISLVLPKEAIDPQSSSRNKLYSGDAWTPTYPKVDFKPDEKVLRKVRDKINALVPYEVRNVLGNPMFDTDNATDSLNRYNGNMVEAYKRDDAMKYAYLKDTGSDISLPTKEEDLVRYGEVSNSAVRYFSGKLVNGLQTVEHYQNMSARDMLEDKALTEAVADALNWDVLRTLEPGSPEYTEYKRNPLFLADEVTFRDVDRLLSGCRKLFTNGIQQTVDRKAAKELIRDTVDQAAYESWLEDLFSGVVEKEGIRNNKDYFTPSGNRRSFEALNYEHNLENVIKAMRETGEKGIGNGFGGASIFGASTTEFSSIEDMKRSSDRLQMMSYEEYQELRKQFTDRFLDIAIRLPNTKNSFSATDSAAEVLTEAVAKYKTRSGIANYLRRELKGWATYSDQVVDDLIDLVNDIRKMPTGYFEAKPQRAVGFDEVGVFVIPRNADIKLKQELLNRGYSIAEYDPDVEGDRQKVVNQFEEYKFSLSNAGEVHKQYGNYNVSGKDIALETAPVSDNVAPVQESVQESVQETVSEKESVVPVAEVTDMFPDTPVQDIEELMAEAKDIMGAMEAYEAVGDTASVEQLMPEYEAVMEKIGQIEEEDRQRVDSLTEGDIPPEMDAPYSDGQPAHVEDPFEDRDWHKVGNQKVKAYMYENPEVKPFFQSEALNLLGELNSTTKGERWYNDEVYYESGGEKGFGGVKRHTSASMEELLDGWGMSYADIEKGLNAIIEDHGAENIAAAKKLEFMLNDRLLNGYKDFYTNGHVPPNQDYINLLTEKQITEYSKEAFDAFMAHADEYAPPVAEDIEPIADSDIAPVASTPPAFSEVKTEQKNVQEGQQAMWEGVKQEYEAIRPKRGKEPRMAKATPEEQARAQILTEEPKVDKKKPTAWNLFKDNIVDKGTVFETLSLKTGNRELQGRWKAIGRSKNSAQWFMEHGNASTSSLKSIRDTVEKSGKTQQFYEYLYHQHNVDRMNLSDRYEDVENKPVFGYDVTSEMSKEEAAKLEAANPEFKEWAKEVYDYMTYLREMMVDSGVISSETAKLWAEMYPHYVPVRRLGDEGLNINVALDTKRTGVNAPVKRATGGNRNILPLFDTMAMRTEQTFKAVARNRFGVELKNMLGTTIENEAVDIDEAIDSVETELIQEGKDGRNPTFTVFENGEKVTFEITEEMYDTMKPKSKAMGYTNKILNTANNIRRGLLTEYNPAFMLTNPIKDTQDVLMNSKHPARTYANYPKAIAELIGKGQYYQEYMEHGGEQNTYFDGEEKTFAKEKSGLSKVIGFPLEKISQANNFIERVPRMAEYIASRKEGRSIDVSMLDAARVTTDFSAGGDLVKFANRNGFTFLNASVQGAVQQVRNVREAKAEGLKGWAKLAAKVTVAGLPALLLNHLLWDDDEEYEELSDYVKQNYYIVGKYGDGKFVRIPKGRTLAVIQNAFEQMENLVTGDDEVDLKTFGELVISNLAPNNPLENNLIAPITQALSNKTWYGDDLVPTRLQDLPSEEQYDETTDAVSKWLGEHTPISPYKWNYVLDQYSGAIGDVFLPMITPEAERGNDTLAGDLIAPITDKFTTDSAMKNQNISDFYDKKDELTTNAKASGATEEDVLMHKYMNSINSELSELYAEKRNIQNSDLSNAEKYEAVRDIQKQIVDLTRESLATYDDIDYQSARDGEYVNIGNRYFKQDDDGEWQELSGEQVTKYKVTSAAGNSSYASDGTNHYRWYVSEDGETEGWRKISGDELERQNKVTKGLGISPEAYWDNKEEYSYAYDHPENYAVAKAVGGYNAYRGYSKELYDIKADKDKNGKSISGSRKEKVLDYINGLDADYGEKIILFKSEYPADDTYNYEIIDYLNSRDDISYSEMETILKELGFNVSSDGNITWD